MRTPQALLKELNASATHIQSLRQCWNWILHDSTFWIDPKRYNHAQRVLLQYHESFRVALLHQIIKEKAYNAQLARTYVLLECPQRVGTVAWYMFFFSIPDVTLRTTAMKELALSVQAKQDMGPAHVFVRIAAKFGVECLLPLSDYNHHHSQTMEHALNRIVFEIMERRPYAERDPQAGEQQQQQQPRMTEEDFLDLLAFGWHPTLHMLVEFPFEWLNLLLPIIYPPLFARLISVTNIWNFYPLYTLEECCFHAAIPSSVRGALRGRYSRDQAVKKDLTEYSEHVRPFSRRSRKPLSKSSEKKLELFPSHQSFLLTWRYLHPEVRVQLFNVVQKASPLAREYFVRRLTVGSSIELLKSSSFFEFYQSVLNRKPLSQWECHCRAPFYKLERKITKASTHEVKCPSLTPHDVFPFALHGRPWFLTAFCPEDGLVFNDARNVHQPWKKDCADEVLAIVNLLGVCYARNLHVRTIVNLLGLHQSSTRLGLGQEKMLRHVLGLFSTQHLVGQPNVAQLMQDKVFRKDETWSLLLRNVQETLRLSMIQ